MTQKVQDLRKDKQVYEGFEMPMIIFSFDNDNLSQEVHLGAERLRRRSFVCEIRPRAPKHWACAILQIRAIVGGTLLSFPRCKAMPPESI